MHISPEELRAGMLACRKCALRAGCTQVVPGEGDLHADVMFIGEGPGAEEDRLGRPFVGASGQLLTQMLAAIGLTREEVYIANVVKCRPPHNRDPLPEEAQACLPFLRAQLLLVRPRIIVLLGRVACRYTVGPLSITREHGRWIERKGYFFMPTFHPSALLRNPADKRAAWEDFKKVRDRLAQLRAEEPHDPV